MTRLKLALLIATLATPALASGTHGGGHEAMAIGEPGDKAKVTQTMDSTTNPPYTYIEATDEKGQKTWLALPQMKVKVGDTIEYPDSPPMTNFHSKALNRTFDKLSMVPGIRIVK